MLPIDEPKAEPTLPATPPPGSKRKRGLGFQLAALGLIVISALAGTGLARLLRTPPVSPPPSPSGQPTLPALFRDWPEKLDLVFVLSAQMHGYVLPCGCSRPQIGGLERRYNFLQTLKDRGWPVIPLDLGDLTQKQGPRELPNLQGMIKYRHTMHALKIMGYQAVSFGEYEAAMGLLELLPAWALQDDGRPRVMAANMSEPDFREFLPAWLPVGPEKGLAAGVTAIIGPSVKELIEKDDKVKFAPTPKTLEPILKEMDEKKVQFRVMLYHGSATKGGQGFPPEAIALAKAYPQFQVVLCLSESDEPAANPVVVAHQDGKKTMVVSLGHKGKYVGVVGVSRTNNPAKPFDLRYQLVELTETYLTPEGKEKGHPIVDLMEAYTRELKKENYLAQYPQIKHPMQVALPPDVPTFVGSAACKGCHKEAYKIWEKSPHSHAYKTLVNAQRPALRQHDPECIVCHTVGFGYHTGFVDDIKTPKLTNVGCESCHGPGSEHIKNGGNDARWYKLMNPWKAEPNETAEQTKKRKFRIDLFCQKCHDQDNDVTWTHGGFDKKWKPLIAH